MVVKITVKTIKLLYLHTSRRNEDVLIVLIYLYRVVVGQLSTQNQWRISNLAHYVKNQGEAETKNCQ